MIPNQRFPFTLKTAHTLKIREQHVITVTGKAFYDIAHAPADHIARYFVRLEAQSHGPFISSRVAVNDLEAAIRALSEAAKSGEKQICFTHLLGLESIVASKSRACKSSAGLIEQVVSNWRLI